MTGRNGGEQFDKRPHWVAKEGGPFYEINPRAVVVYERLLALERAHGNKRYAYVSMQTLAETCRMSEGTVSKMIAVLVSAQMIDKLNRPSKGFAGMYRIVRFPPPRSAVRAIEDATRETGKVSPRKGIEPKIGFRGGGAIQKVAGTQHSQFAIAEVEKAESWLEG